MVTKNQRLCQSADIRRCFNENSRLSGRFYTVFWSKSTNPARFCVVVSKKTSKLAVKRNKIRRIAKEAFRCLDGTPLLGDCVILARQSSSQASNRELRQCIDKLLTKVAAYQVS